VNFPVSGLLMVPQAPSGGSPMVLVVQLGLIFLILYWLILRPQRKDRERHQQLIQGLRKGDEVVTAGGLIGTVVHVEEDRVTLRSGENTRVVVDRVKVTRKLGDRPGSTEGER
jgi:preprotein translocase subunit YajC